MSTLDWRKDDGGGVFATAMLCTLVLLMVLPEGLDYARLGTGNVADPSASPSTNNASAITRGLWLLLLAGGMALLARRLRLAVAILRFTNPWLGIATLLAVLSLGWSIDPSLSGRRLFRLFTAVICLLGFMVVDWRAGRLEAVLRPLVSGLLAASLAFGIACPEYAIHRELAPELVGAWRGVASHKNALGGLASLGCLLWIHAGVAGHCSRLRAMAGLALSLTCLWLSRSSTAMLAAILVSGYLLAFSLTRARQSSVLRTVSAGLVTLGMVAGLGSVNLLPGWHALSSPFAMLAGKDPSITGRAAIWMVVREHVARRPWLGSGYGAYWVPDHRLGTESGTLLARLGGFYPGTAHNGYLDITNDLGLLGLAVLGAFIFRQARDAWRLAGGDWWAGVGCLAVLLQQCITNLSESHWLNVTSVDFVVMTAFSLALARQQLQLEFMTRYGPPPERNA